MAHATLELIVALRSTAKRLAAGADYKWSHFGQCNCGHLAQTVTRLKPRELQRAAFGGGGDWGEQAREYCPTSGQLLDDVFAQLFAHGMVPQDVQHLERLSDPVVLKRLGVARLKHNDRRDVVRYMEAWAEVLEASMTPADMPMAAE